jgi:UDP-N-acetylglucosamine-lysosomal-enzyme
VDLIYDSLYGLSISEPGGVYDIPVDTHAMYFNLSSIIGNNTITDGSHDNGEIVRTATISQRHKIMVLTFHRDQPRQQVLLSVTYDDNANQTEITWNITVTTMSINANATALNGTSVDAGNSTASAVGGTDGEHTSSNTTSTIEAPTNTTSGPNNIGGEHHENDENKVDGGQISIEPSSDAKRADDQQDHADPQQPQQGQEQEQEQEQGQGQEQEQEAEQEQGQEAEQEQGQEAEHDQAPQQQRHLLEYVDTSSDDSDTDVELTELKALSAKEPMLDSHELLLMYERAKSGNEYWPWKKDTAAPTRRKLLDMFGSSLKHVDSLFNKKFGHSARKVPAHMPHMINKRIMKDLQDAYVVLGS